MRELQGMQCIDLDDAPAPKKEIACTRSFGHAVTELPPLVEAVSEFASRAAEKLRKQGSLTSQLLVFAHTSPFRPGPRFNKSVVVPLRRPTADTGKLLWAAAAGMRHIYEPSYKMAKGGSDASGSGAQQRYAGRTQLGRGGPTGQDKADGGVRYAQPALRKRHRTFGRHWRL